MLNLLHSVTNEEQCKKRLCNESSNYQECGRKPWKSQREGVLSGVSALSIAGETRNTSTAPTAVTQEQTVLIYIVIDWVEYLHIAACWRDTQHEHCGIYYDPLKVEQTVLLLLLSGVSALSIIAHILSSREALLEKNWYPIPKHLCCKKGEA